MIVIFLQNTADGKWMIPVLDRMHMSVVDKHCLVELSLNHFDKHYYVSFLYKLLCPYDEYSCVIFFDKTLLYHVQKATISLLLEFWLTHVIKKIVCSPKITLYI